MVEQFNKEDRLGAILLSLKNNSDEELRLLQKISRKLGTVSHQQANGKTSPINDDSPQKVANPRRNGGNSSPVAKSQTNDNPPQISANSRRNSDRKQLIGDISQAVDAGVSRSLDKQSKKLRKNEVVGTPIKRKKPTFNGKSTTSNGDLATNDGQSTTPQEKPKKSPAQSAPQIGKSAELPDEYTRDANGRLRKNGRYASAEETKAYETKQKIQEAETAKRQSKIAKLVGALNDHLVEQVNSGDAVEAAGVGLGGSFAYAIKDTALMVAETKENIKKAKDFFRGDDSEGDSSRAVEDRLSSENHDKRLLSETQRQTHAIDEQIATQEDAYKDAIRLLNDIDENTKLQKQNLFSNLGGLSSVLGGLRERLGSGKGGKGGTVITGNKGNKGNGGEPAKKTGSVTVAETKSQPSKQPKTVLDNGVEKTKMPPASAYGRVASMAKRIPFLGALVTAGGAYMGLNDRDDLTLEQKAIQTGTTTVGALGGGSLGAWGGATLGATVGSVVPVVGTAVGGLLGGLIGGIGGGWLGEKAGSQVGENISLSIDDEKTTTETLISAWDKTLEQSKKLLTGIFGDSLTAAKELVAPNPSKNAEMSSEAIAFNKNDAIEKRISQYEPIINEMAQKYGVSPDLIKSVIRQESGGKANAQSGVGAQGLMQLMPSTAKDLGVKNSFDPRQNIEGGTKYLSRHIAKYRKKGFNDNDAIKLALASYNAGGGWVDASIRATGGSTDGETVLAKMNTQDVKLRGHARSKSNLKQSDDYVDKIMGSYLYRTYDPNSNAPAAIATSQHDADLFAARMTAMTGHSMFVPPLGVDRVSAINAQNNAMPIPPQKVVVTNAGGNASTSTTTTNTTNNSVVNNNNSKKARDVVIPTDFDDRDLALATRDLN